MNKLHSLRRMLIAAILVLQALMAEIIVLPIAFAHADGSTAPSTPPTPGIVNSTGGNQSSSNPGSSCSVRMGVRAAPLPQSPVYLWSQSQVSGWPFGWPGLAPVVQPSPPVVGCSR